MKAHALVAALTTLASSGFAQMQTECHVGAIPMQLTNFTRITSLPRFDPTLGELISIELQVSASVRGSARIESLDAAASLVATQFAVDMEITQSDMPLALFMIPVANFLDSFAAYDGTIDFGGTSGLTHDGIEAHDQMSYVLPMTPENRAIFSGTGMIDFVADAQANSSAAGGGNLIAQFDTMAGVDVQVCYAFLGNNPPVVDCPGPLMASVGVPVSFQVCAADPDANDVVTLNGVLPPGAVANPPFPVVGNPACTTITWIPQSDQVGNIQFVFTANDIGGSTATCTTVVGSAECHMVFGVGVGNSSLPLFGHLYDTQLARVRMSFPVTMVDHPSFGVRCLPPVFTMQVLMFNPLMFPGNATQWSRAMTVYRHPDYSITTSYSGDRNGIDVQAQTFLDDGGRTRLRFPFTIQGL